VQSKAAKLISAKSGANGNLSKYLGTLASGL
jgi:hypothetical protein